MFISSFEGATASTVFSAEQSSVAHGVDQPPEAVCHMLFGSPDAVRATIKHLHKLRYAEANDWSQPISTGRLNEVMAVLTKKVKVFETPPAQD